MLIRDHHDGYIDWGSFEDNLKMIRDNNLNLGSDESVGAVRAGQGILCGLLRCGRCRRKLQVRYWGKSGTAARYLCKGDFDSGGKYCIAFGGATVDRRFGKELMKVLSPLGIKASVEAIERLCSKEDERREALGRKLEQIEYEAKRAFEQYDEVDPRNRLVAEGLERRWEGKLEEMEELKTALSEIEQEVSPLTEKEEEEVLRLGELFGEVWESEFCPAPMKKKIIRTVVEEVVVNLDEQKGMLYFTIHWKGGTHTQFEMPKPVSGAGQKTSLEDIEVIRKMGERYGDDEIARVLNKLGRCTGKGKRWSEQSVRTVRNNYSIEGQRRSTPDPNILTLGQAAKYCNVSQTTIKRLVGSGVLKKEQVVSWAPWEIRRTDLDSEEISKILERLRETGRLVIEGVDSSTQKSLFIDI